MGEQTAHRLSVGREITPEEITAAASRIEKHVRRTPVLETGDLLGRGFSLVFKLEHLQVTGSFKPRGAFSLLTATDVPTAGVVAASGGNFGIAVAHAASRLGLPATIFVPESSPAEKIGRIGSHGARVEVVPGYYDDALAASRRHAAETGACQAHAYDQPAVVAGQGTMARELEEQSQFDVVLVAVGGGGLIGGVASWVRDRSTVVAVEPVECQSLHASLAAGRQVEVEVGGVAASSLGARTVGDHAWAARHWIDESVVVSDEVIVDAQRLIWSELRLAVEPAAAATVAALTTGAYTPPRGSRVVAVLSGGNVDPASVG
jgi:threonine dehydratase